MKKVNILVLVLVFALCAMSSSAFADSLGFTSDGFQQVTVTANGAGGLVFNFGSAHVSGATPATDSLLFFPNNPFSIGNGITLHGDGSFNPFATAVQVGNSAFTNAGLLTGTIDFISIFQNAGSPGAFAINVGLVNLNYACGPGCLSSGVLSELAGGGAGNLTFTFGFTDGPQTMSDLLAMTGATAGTSSSTNNGFTGIVNTVPEPASLALLGSGLLAGGNFVRRKLAVR